MLSEFEERKRQREEEADAKTAKNRAKRQKKKERAKGVKPTEGRKAAGPSEEQSLKKRRVVNGKELVFRKPGEESDEESDEELPGSQSGRATVAQELASPPGVPIAETPTIMIHEDF